jgi:prolyl oligopeptidase
LIAFGLFLRRISCEVFMSGGMRLVFGLVLPLTSLFVLAAALYAGDDPQPAKASGPPNAEKRPLEENFHGTKIVDNYRWLEDGKSPETEKWVEGELAYTRALLDPLPGRDAIHKRLTELLTIGSISAPQIGGKYYFCTRREGMQNQPVVYVREGVDGKERVLVDVNQLAADGTIALDWYQPSENGKYLVYGTSPSGSEMSTLHILETKTGTLLPDTIERTRGASIAWMPNNSGFYYTRYPKKGEVAEGQEMYNRRVFYHELGSDPATDPLIFGEGARP